MAADHDPLVVLITEHTKQDADNFDALHEEIVVLRAEVTKLADKLSTLSQTITSYKGFVGGVVFVVSALFTVIAVVARWWK